MRQFLEKPDQPPGMPGDETQTLASMGNYIFNRRVLVREAQADASTTSSTHDFGKDLLPRLWEREPVYVYDFGTNHVPGEGQEAAGFWVDIGTIEAYHQASMELVDVSPTFNLYTRHWPIRCAQANLPPAKFVFADRESRRGGIATDSMVSEGCVVSGGHLERSILGPQVRVNSYSHVSESVLFEGVSVGRHARIRRAIIDKGVHIPENTTIGYDEDEDRKRYFVSPEGIVVIPKDGPLADLHTSTLHKA